MGKKRLVNNQQFLGSIKRYLTSFIRREYEKTIFKKTTCVIAARKKKPEDKFKEQKIFNICSPHNGTARPIQEEIVDD